MTVVVLDTCVIVDMFMHGRPRHAKAVRLKETITASNITVRIPAFAMFEISHAVRQEKRLNGGQIVEGAAWEGVSNGLEIDAVPIDESFINRYLDVGLPEMRAGDLVFAALAKGEGLPLVTEDRNFLTAAETAGIQVFSIDAYLNHVLGSAG
ncbi:MAG: PIN domain-containing protein [Rhodocyclaceae bacterium]|nr:MAG: PIN domain-containing protein [Rhodocyclaceae bacterium]